MCIIDLDTCCSTQIQKFERKVMLYPLASSDITVAIQIQNWIKYDAQLRCICASSFETGKKTKAHQTAFLAIGRIFIVHMKPFSVLNLG